MSPRNGLPVKYGRVNRVAPKVEPTELDVQVHRLTEQCEGCTGYKVKSIPRDWREDSRTFSRVWSRRPKVLRLAVEHARRVQGRVLRRTRLGWAEHTLDWWVSVHAPVDEKRLTDVIRTWIGLSLKDALALARTLNANPGPSLTVPLTFTESERARTADEATRALLAHVGLTAWSTWGY